jgi:hypothetical protein
MPAKINKDLLRKNLEKVISNNNRLVKQAQSIAEDLLNRNLKEYINELSEHPVSKEISEGVNAQNLSRTLNGDGNLFTFIGFESNAKPIDELKDNIKSNTFVKFKDAKNDAFNFSVFTPSPEEISQNTPMPFEGGKSWVKGVEKGISGFSNYLYGLIFPQSRSGRAIQTENKIRRATFRPVGYFTKLYTRFIKNFNL